jgi:hypothetical protein
MGTPGNQNALKHGLYAKRFTKPERAALKKMPADDLTLEIAALRVIGDRILAELDKTQDVDTKAKLVNSFVNAVTALSTVARTHAILNGTYNPLDEALQEALMGLQIYE